MNRRALQSRVQAVVEERVERELARLNGERNYEERARSGDISLTFAFDRLAKHFFELGRQAGFEQAYAATEAVSGVWQMAASGVRSVAQGDDDAPSIEITGDEEIAV